MLKHSKPQKVRLRFEPNWFSVILFWSVLFGKGSLWRPCSMMLFDITLTVPPKGRFYSTNISVENENVPNDWSVTAVRHPVSWTPAVSSSPFWGQRYAVPGRSQPRWAGRGGQGEGNVVGRTAAQSRCCCLPIKHPHITWESKEWKILESFSRFIFTNQHLRTKQHMKTTRTWARHVDSTSKRK